MKPVALLHVGLAKCASTFIGDQALKAQARGDVTALYWRPFDVLINRAFGELGLGVTAFPEVPLPPISLSADRPLIASNECLTGHFPQPLRLVSHPVYDGAKLQSSQRRMADMLLALSRDSLAPFEAKVLLIVRNPRAWLHSVYRNLVVMGVAEEPEIFFGTFGSVVAQWANVNYLVALYRELFGANRVSVLPLEMLRNDPAGFFRAVNELAGAPVLVENDARNVGLSDGASERFRKLWCEVDRIAPPQPSWSNWTVRYKQETWEFLHNAILNDEEALKRANAVWADESILYRMPDGLVNQMADQTSVLEEFDACRPYLEAYR